MKNVMALCLLIILVSCAFNRERKDREFLATRYSGLNRVQGISQKACEVFSGYKELYVTPSALDALSSSESKSLRACLNEKNIKIDTCVFKCEKCQPGDDCRCGDWYVSKQTESEFVISESDCGVFPTVQGHHFALKVIDTALSVDSLLRNTSFQH